MVQDKVKEKNSSLHHEFWLSSVYLLSYNATRILSYVFQRLELQPYRSEY
jgi:hypothetical protein